MVDKFVPTYRTTVGPSFFSSICPAAASLRALRLRQWYQTARINAKTIIPRMEKMPARMAGLTLGSTGQVKTWPKRCKAFSITYLRIPSSFPPLAVGMEFGRSEKLKVLSRPFKLSPGIPVERGPATVVVE